MNFTETYRMLKEALEDTGRFATVASWLGDANDLDDSPKQIPAAYLILTGADYDNRIALRQSAAVSRQVWSVIIFEMIDYNEDETAEIAAYNAIESTVAAITNLKVGNYLLWPTQARLFGSIKNSICSYGIQFTMI